MILLSVYLYIRILKHSDQRGFRASGSHLSECIWCVSALKEYSTMVRLSCRCGYEKLGS